jgi:hypothetical protein
MCSRQLGEFAMCEGRYSDEDELGTIERCQRILGHALDWRCAHPFPTLEQDGASRTDRFQPRAPFWMLEHAHSVPQGGKIGSERMRGMAATEDCDRSGRL